MFRKISLIVIVSLFVFGMSKLSFAMMCGDHSNSQQVAQGHSEHEHGATEATKDTTTKESVNVGNKICPVTGEKIDQKLKATYEYKGKIYNFCCAACVDEFKNDPQKYIKKVEEELQDEAKKQKSKKEESHAEGSHSH